VLQRHLGMCDGVFMTSSVWPTHSAMKFFIDHTTLDSRHNRVWLLDSIYSTGGLGMGCRQSQA
jgi:hypothetical protein